MRDEQDFYIGQCNGADERKISEVVVDFEPVPGRDTRLREALARVAEGERAPIVVALARLIKERAGLDDQFYPTLGELRAQSFQKDRYLTVARCGQENPHLVADAPALRVLLNVLEGL